jgi:hypothetical protein
MRDLMGGCRRRTPSPVPTQHYLKDLWVTPGYCSALRPLKQHALLPHSVCRQGHLSWAGHWPARPGSKGQVTLLLAFCCGPG